MLVVRQVEAEAANEIAYECYEGGAAVGRLVARWRSPGNLEVELKDTTRNEAGRTLVAKLERDALKNGVTGLYLLARSDKERDQFYPAGYDPVEEGSLRLFKLLKKS